MSEAAHTPTPDKLLNSREAAERLAALAMSNLGIDKTKSGITYHDVRLAAELAAQSALEFSEEYEPAMYFVEEGEAPEAIQS